MDDQKRRDDGMAQRRKVLGDAWVDKSIANRNSFNTDFQDLITRYAWGEIWTRPHFDQRTRRVLVIGTMVALGQWDEFRLHVRAALAEGGFTADDIKEILLQQAIYCGVPGGQPRRQGSLSDCRGAGPAEAIGRRLPRPRSICDQRRTFDQQDDRGAEQHQQFGRVQPQRAALADLRCHHHAGKTDHAADRQRHRQRLVAAAGLADRGAGDQYQKDRKKGHHRELAQRQQPRQADRGQSRPAADDR